MKYVLPAPWSQEFSAVTYEFLNPVRVIVQMPSGARVLTGYGISEQVQVMEPKVQYLVTSYQLKPEIFLADGSKIVEYPADMRTRRVWA